MFISHWNDSIHNHDFCTIWFAKKKSSYYMYEINVVSSEENRLNTPPTKSVKITLKLYVHEHFCMFCFVWVPTSNQQIVEGICYFLQPILSLYIFLDTMLRKDIHVIRDQSQKWLYLRLKVSKFKHLDTLKQKFISRLNIRHYERISCLDTWRRKK